MFRLPLLAALALAAVACHDDRAIEPPDPGAIDADGDSRPAAIDCDDTDPDVWRDAQVFADADEDRLGAGEASQRCVGAALPRGFAPAGGDCAPDDAARWQNLPYAFRDADGDLRTIASLGEICGGESLPAGFSVTAQGNDCDDSNPARFVTVELALDEDLDGVGAGELVSLCTDGGPEPGYASTTGDCAPADGTRWRDLHYAFRDVDGDGATIVERGDVCSGHDLPATYLLSSRVPDCDDTNAAVHVARSLYVDADGDGLGDGTLVMLCTGSTSPAGYVSLDGDCAPDDAARFRTYEYNYRDADRDGYTVGGAGTVCAGSSFPAGYVLVSFGPDCDDDDPSRRFSRTVYEDEDGDRIGAGPAQIMCTGARLPAGFTIIAGDCAPADATAWRVLQGFRDGDGDSVTVAVPIPVCVGTGLPSPYHATATGNDCDDTNALVYRYLSVYPDRDGDGVGTTPRQVSCLGARPPGTLSLYGDDFDDSDPARTVDPDEDDALLVIL